MKRISCFFAALLCVTAFAHTGDHPSIHDTMASVLERLKEDLSPEDLRNLTPQKAFSVLTEEELEIFAESYTFFTVNVPVNVYIARDTRQKEVPFWLESRGFEKTDMTVDANGHTFELWVEDFEPGEVGLGVNGFVPHDEHYFVVIEPKDGVVEDLKISDVYPALHRPQAFEEGARIYRDDRDFEVEAFPAALVDAQMLISLQKRAEETQLVDVFRLTDYPSTPKPDQIALTWSDDPTTTQTVQWRTDTSVEKGIVEVRKAGGAETAWKVAAEMHVMEDPGLVNDPVCHRFTARILDLKPGAQYVYRVGDGTVDGWTEWTAFTTAPAEIEPFKFIYMGDAQNGLDTWGNLVQKSFQAEPDAAFYVMAGDLVNRGVERDDWDSFFANAVGIYDRRQLIPAIGNHEDQGDNGPWMYLDIFDLPKNGPEEIDTERAYTVEYSNAIFIVLDSNVSAMAQAGWLEEQLANTDATWKFVVYHHPMYSSAPGRDNRAVREFWGPIFDKYHVDLALQGHDHAYLRTYPMKGNEPVASPADGTIYIVSVSGTKYYDQNPRSYTQFGMTEVSTYQVLDIQIEGDTLTYKAYDVDGEIRDEFIIEK